MSEKLDRDQSARHGVSDRAEGTGGCAPMIYFEDAAVFADLNGTIRITLEALRLYSSRQGGVAERVAVAHLRMNIQAARALKLVLDAALLLAKPPAPNTVVPSTL